jgi:mycothiol synthase
MAFYYNFVGTRGSAKVMKMGSAPAQCWTACDDSGGQWQELPCEFFQGVGGRSDLEAMLADFVESVRGDTKPPVDVHESMDMQLPGIVAHESGLRGGVRLDVPDSRTFGEPPRQPQLMMVWPKRLLGAPPALRCFADSDTPAYCELLASAGFQGWDAGRVGRMLQMVVPDGFFVVEHVATGSLVATAMALHRPRPDLPFAGEMGWVAAAPEHRGKHLGRAVCSAVTARLLGGGYRAIYLLTDDWRLPAVKTYLKLGYEPVLTGEGMAERWRKVGDAVGRPI